MNVVISAPALLQRLASGHRTVLLDVRWVLGDPHGRAKYLAGHLPGALYVDLPTELAGPGEPRDGRHPLPREADFAATVRRWGVRSGDTVVVYDDAGATAAARAWWLLGYAGVPHVYLLDGGLAAWRAAGGALSTGAVTAPPGDVVVRFGARPILSVDEAAAWPGHGILLDARAGERFRGEHEPIDPRAGHIPGARSAPTTANLDADGAFLPAAALRARFAALGITGERAVAVYCGSGVTAAHEIAALEMAGIHASLFPASFSAWSQRPELPVARGDNDDKVEA